MNFRFIYPILVILFAEFCLPQTITSKNSNYIYSRGAIVRGDTSQKNIALVFTGDEFADGGESILQSLKNNEIKASFFFTGNFYRNENFSQLIKSIKNDGSYLGAHSDKHLLYSPWENRDSLLVSFSEFKNDLLNNYKEMKKFNVDFKDAQFFLPPYEWYNETIADWTDSIGLTLINFSPGTKSHADYTTPEMKNYINSYQIFQSIFDYEVQKGLNGFILTSHIGTSPEREDKFYYLLDDLILKLKNRGYTFLRIDELLNKN